jgi:hypothetical protein
MTLNNFFFLQLLYISGFFYKSCESFIVELLQEGVVLTSDRVDAINVIYISKLMLKVFYIRKLMQNTYVNTLDGDNQLHPIFYLHQHFIT